MNRQARSSRTQRGQAIVEFALITPILVLLILGTVDASFLASDKLLMITASRHGSRIGAQLGGLGDGTNTCQGTLPAGTLQTTIDKEIVQSVAAVAQGAGFALIQKIDIYQPTLSNGAYSGPPGGADLVDSWSINIARTAWVASGPQTYTLDKRCQGRLGHEAPIAVRVTWDYIGVNKIIRNITGITEYSDELMTLKDPSLP